MMRVGSSAWLSNFSSLGFVLFLLIINHAAIFVKGEAGCTISCGKLNSISYPFRLRDDPEHCGEADYELVCENDEAFFYMDGHKYFVTQIESTSNWIGYSGTMIIHVDCSFTTSTCRLRDNSSSKSFPSFIYNSRYLYSWASFMNCSEKIENDTFFPVPSLSDENATDYVVVGEKANELSYLHKSCKFVDTFIFKDDYRHMNSSLQVTEALHKGFNLSWYPFTDTNCWIYALMSTGALSDSHSFDFQVLALHPFNIIFKTLSCLLQKACRGKKCLTILPFIISSPGYILLVLLGLTIVFKFVLSPLAVCVYLVYNYRENTKPLDSIEKFLQKQEVLLPRRFTYGEITIMTKYFKEKLGKGGFGHVYKGELFGGHLVAIKVLEGLHFNGEDFINEVSTIGIVHHVNIVQLIGFCSEGTKRALVYEYMPNGSLDKYLFSSDGKTTNFSLTIEKLHNIALDIAKGINYLHTGCNVQILHFDIKPHNILLDDNFIPKISDFGLAKLHPKDQSLVSISAARGTIGYIAPELISRGFGVISHKSDVYSFGMLILEMAGRRRNFDTRMQDSNEIYFPSWIYDQLTKLEASNSYEIREIGELEKRLCKVGLWCIQMRPSNRPTMSEVIKFLESNVDCIKMPPEPFFLSTDASTEECTDVHSSSSALPIIIENIT